MFISQIFTHIHQNSTCIFTIIRLLNRYNIVNNYPPVDRGILTDGLELLFPVIMFGGIYENKSRTVQTVFNMV